VLGGNASSEIRLWILGATSHMGNNNRWAREGGVIDEILVENLFRNREGNPLILDTILLEKVTAEAGITLLLNTAVYQVDKSSERSIGSIRGFCSQNATRYELSAPLFCDATGDGLVSFLAGAGFRMGAESREEFSEGLAPEEGYGELLGHSMYFYSKRVGTRVKFVPPAFALQDIRKIPRYKNLNPQDDGCRLWWIEYGGRNDTVHDTELIKWELWRVVYGVWNFIKNSGTFSDVDNLTLEWVGTIPGKRESRRFEGMYMLTQQDVVDQTPFKDAVAFGGWALDLHPADGVYSQMPSCNQWHSKGVYQIPYRCYVSRDIDNLFFAGRIISTTHVAFGSSRVMGTCSLGAQAVAMAAVLCRRHDLLPADLTDPTWMNQLQQALNRRGQSIPGIPIRYGTDDLMAGVLIRVSSTCKLASMPPDGPWLSLETGTGQLLPAKKDTVYHLQIIVRAEGTTLLKAQLAVSSKPSNYTPDMILDTLEINVGPGEQVVDLVFNTPVPSDRYCFVLLARNPALAVRGSETRLSGILSVFNGENRAVSNYGYQEASEDSGIASFAFWCPRRRPHGHNLALDIFPALEPYDASFLHNGFTRPYLRSNAWVADQADPHPTVTLRWETKQKISVVYLHFDTDFDHPLESSLFGHPEDVIPFCVREYRLYDDQNRLVTEVLDNHQTINALILKEPLHTDSLRIEMAHPSSHTPVALFEIRCA
ncbi:MAG TPA: FAD-dependent oxidoreductase, partial [Chitinophagaceae bacterium]|nr:FAD-dependent oxidoreductase [Chitinophagaceae bacterium]